MTTTLIINAILSLAVVVMVVSLLAWAIRTAHRDLPSATVWARLHGSHGTTPVDGDRHPSGTRWRGARGRQAWETS